MGVKDDEIVIIGRSLGTSFASYLGQQRPKRHLLTVVSSFPRLSDVSSIADLLKGMIEDDLNLMFYPQPFD